MQLGKRSKDPWLKGVIMTLQILERMDERWSDRQTTIAKDLKLNFRRLVGDSSLSEQEATLVLIGLAKATGYADLFGVAREVAIADGISAELAQEAEESAAIMGMLNVYYRFRHFIEHEDPAAKDEYGAAKLRMTSLANPAMGKETFEMLAFAISCINGCERCVTSHEKALMVAGVEREKIHDLGRLAAVVMGLSRL
jgi:alkyl hydroperoxide reductase subunit D